MAQVVVEERLYNETFVKEQTDLPLLVRLDTMAYLRGCDLMEGGRDDQFYWADAGNGAVCEAPRHTLSPGEIEPALEGRWTATLKDAEEVQVTTVFELAKQRLGDYTPEKASALCGVSPEMIRMLARKVATKRTNVICSLSNASKYYHGDLIERSELLLLALTGNWGRKGTGVRAWTGGLFDGMGFASARQKGTPEEPQEILGLMRQMVQAMKATDPTMTDELAAIE